MKIPEEQITPVQVSVFVQHGNLDTETLTSVPAVHDINAQYQQGKAGAMNKLSVIAAQCNPPGGTTVIAYEDADFQPVSSSLWCDECRPPPNDWIVHPNEWARPGRI